MSVHPLPTWRHPRTSRAARRRQVSTQARRRHRHATGLVPGEEVGAAAARAEPGCGARWAGAARPWGVLPPGRRNRRWGAQWRELPARRRGRRRGAELVRVRPARPEPGGRPGGGGGGGVRHPFWPRGLAVTGNHVAFLRGSFGPLGSLCSLELGLVLLPQLCQALGSQACARHTQPGNVVVGRETELVVRT